MNQAPPAPSEQSQPRADYRAAPTRRPPLALGAAHFGAALLRARKRFRRTETITADGTQLATWIGGAKEGRPVVFLHGFCSDHSSMTPLALAAADTQPIVLYDARGHGASSQFGTTSLMQTLGEDLLEVLRQHAPDGADVVGLSMGAQTIFEALRQSNTSPNRNAQPARPQKQLFHRFVFIDQSPRIVSGPDWAHGLFGSIDTAALAKVRADLRINPRRLGREWLRGMWRSEEHLGIKLLLSPSMLIGLRPMAKCTLRLADDMLQQDWRDEVRAITAPTLLLYGGRSIYPGAGRWMARHLPHAHFAFFEHSGHALIVEEPKRAARELQAFLQNT